MERDIQPLKSLCTADQNAAVHGSLSKAATSTGPILPIGETSSDRLRSVREYEVLACEIEMHLRKLLEEHNYDTVGNFLEFYQKFKESGYDSVLEFFHMYNPPITPDHFTCVGLALELWNRLSTKLEQKYPGIGRCVCAVSCEEDIDSSSVYTSAHRLDTNRLVYTLEKEHVLMCLKVEFAGRQATMLCDPGYHVARVVTVMADGAYPHTGWFIQSEENNIRKEYNYHLTPTGKNFVEWNEKTTRNGKEEIFTGIIFVGRPYLTAVDVTERRNIVYSFRSLLSRDQKGNLIAGIYYKVSMNCDEFTIFYQNMGKQRIKLKFSDFMRPEVDKELLQKLAICNEQLNLPRNKLLKIVQLSGRILGDTEFLPQVQDIDRSINLLSANN